ncbi:hypothetical protein SMGD1_1676 [Sulfurimonas gotlandica GD1]|jgi:hypothetical protein|uniref:Lipoprotein n=1 Tax=Sulfurimonas gotlandica (strain DSM 19862 / JCM 16533 / GD1) TaxID=929558 RepID=B6BI47_SULGG|nr:hypothetical protein [Sulfurimonas gotlandica]EDZ63083.1 lipoprotein, putative [Sulfurimonas gotlandica GD1]EHP30200.1 hypothetical protein SMGD1_1676 [Sulfurimonas gotlandica GD1]
MKYLLIALALLLTACSTKNYEVTQTKIIIIKSPKLKFADVGYIRNSEKSIELELFVAGKAIEKITINHLICTGEGCMTKGSFNKDYLNDAYPSEILQNILLGREIYNGKNRVQTSEGFEQNIEDENVNITYRVSTNVTFFKDRKNKIIFKIKDTK